MIPEPFGAGPVAAAFAAMLLGCATTVAGTDVAEPVPRQQYSSYVIERGIVAIEDLATAEPDQVAQQRLAKALSEELDDKGFEPGSPGHSDLIVSYSASVRDMQSVVTDRTRPGAWTMLDRDVWVQDYSEARLDVDVIDARNGEVLFRSTAVARNEDFRDARSVREVVDKALREFPNGSK